LSVSWDPLSDVLPLFLSCPALVIVRKGTQDELLIIKQRQLASLALSGVRSQALTTDTLPWLNITHIGSLCTHCWTEIMEGIRRNANPAMILGCKGREDF